MWLERKLHPFSSRKIASKLHEDVAFRVLATENFPAHRTIRAFRALHLEEFTELFTQAVRFARGMSVTSPWHVQSTSHKSTCRARKAKRSEMSLRRLAISLGNYLHCHHA